MTTALQKATAIENAMAELLKGYREYMPLYADLIRVCNNYNLDPFTPCRIAGWAIAEKEDGSRYLIRVEDVPFVLSNTAKSGRKLPLGADVLSWSDYQKRLHT